MSKMVNTHFMKRTYKLYIQVTQQLINNGTILAMTHTELKAGKPTHI